MTWRFFILLAGALTGAAPTGVSAAPGARPSTVSYFERSIVPLLDQYCYSCHGEGRHKGDVALDGWKDEAAALADRKTWERVLQKVSNREMPPENKRQPTPRERARLTDWIEKKVFNCDCDRPDPGRITLRRLNRAEYNNTIRDLLGVDFQPADDFPVDDSGYGFDNIGDALSMPPMLVEKYLAAAQKILDAALVPTHHRPPQVKRFPVDLLEVGYNAKQRGDGWVALNSIEEDDVAVNPPIATAGDYALRVRAYARQDTSNAIQITFMLGNQPLKTVAIETNPAQPAIYETRLALPAGPARLRAVVRRIKDGLSEAKALQWKSGREQKGAVFVQWLEVEGPLDPAPRPPPESHTRIFFRPLIPGREAQAARQILERFATRAYRRPLAPGELDRLVDLAESARAWSPAFRRLGAPPAKAGTPYEARFPVPIRSWKNVEAPHELTPAWSHAFRRSDAPPAKAGTPYEDGIRLALQAILVSPHFLFRGELQREPDNPASSHPVSEFALASRLSYFLWSSMPDDELLALAGRGSLRRHLDQQVRRMLNDPKARALVDNFAGQWLQLRNVDLVTPDPRTFPAFDPELRAAMRRETELLFEHLLRGDRSVVEFLTADYTFVNARLARHYGMTNVHGEAFQRVSLKGTPRRGVLTQAGILTLTSNPTRTSPVKRGKWVLDNLLNAPPPPPPPNVPELKDGRELTGPLRQRMEAHRADALCASCHARMDPIGFGLENFDGIGAWRTRDGGSVIDASGRLAGGESFSGPDELTSILSQQKRDQFVRCLADKMLTYALGRGLEFNDKCALDRICRQLPRHGYRFSTLVLEIVKSAPFQRQRGER